MLIFESISAGGIAILLTLFAVLILVGIYSYFVWPFTHWDLNGLRIADGSWWVYALAIIFCAGSFAGFWCFSGAAFQKKTTQFLIGEPKRYGANQKAPS